MVVGAAISLGGLLSSCGRVGYSLLPSEQESLGNADAANAPDATAMLDGSRPDANSGADARVGVDGGGTDGASVDGGGMDSGSVDAGTTAMDAGSGSPSGLIAWYRFDDDPSDGAFDSSGSGRDAACAAGECPQLVSGRVGGAYDFDGVDDHLQADDSDAHFDGSLAFTFAFWVFARGLNVQMPVIKPFDRFESSWGVELHQPNRAFLFSSQPGVDPPPGSFTPNQWIHYAGTWDGSEGQFYRDGSVVGSFNGPVTFDTNPLVVGGYRTLTTDFANALEGTVDEVMVFDRALSPAEVSSLANP